MRLPFQLPWLSTQRAQGQPFDAAHAAYEAHADKLNNALTHSVRLLLRRWADRASACTDRSPAEHCGHANAKVEGLALRWVSQASSASQQARGPGAAGITPPVLLPNGGHRRACSAT